MKGTLLMGTGNVSSKESKLSLGDKQDSRLLSLNCHSTPSGVLALQQREPDHQDQELTNQRNARLSSSLRI
jgi:hypothetical protein